MNLDKTIQELTNRLNEILPVYSASSSDFKNDGINYWKGKRIISVKEWNELYEKSSTYTNSYKSILASRKPLQYFPDDYNGSISRAEVVDEKLKEEVQKWNTDYYELLEYRKNPILGRKKCSKCLLSGSNDDPIFIGIEKVFARIVSNQCNANSSNNHSDGFITYHCNVMNIFLCPFESIKFYNQKEIESKYPYKREDLFSLHQISFAIEQAISTFFELTKDNEIIYEVDFENDRVHEIHTKYNGEPQSWGWHENINEQLSKVKPISNIVIRDEGDIHDILTNREKLETLIEEYENKINSQLGKEVEQEVCCDENTPCVNSSDNEKLLTNNILSVSSSQSQVKYQNSIDDSYKRENPHNKSTKEELDMKHIKPNLKEQIKYELEEHEKKQQILLKENKQIILEFLLDNKDSIRIEDLKIYEPIYKCYRQKGICDICNVLTNIICRNCNRYYNNKEVWLCTYHWQQHIINHN